MKVNVSRGTKEEKHRRRIKTMAKEARVSERKIEEAEAMNADTLTRVIRVLLMGLGALLLALLLAGFAARWLM